MEALVIEFLTIIGIWIANPSIAAVVRTANTRLVSTLGLSWINATLSNAKSVELADNCQYRVRRGEPRVGTPFACVTSAVIATVWEPSGALSCSGDLER